MDEDPIDDYYDYDDEDSSLPPLLKRLPKDFGAIVASDASEAAGNISGTMIVKTDRGRSSSFSSPAWKPRSAPLFDRNSASPRDLASVRKSVEVEEEEEGEGEGDFSTFVVRSGGERETLTGTVVRRGSGGGDGSTMSMAVASMQAVGELGFGKKQQAKGSSGSSSSIPDESISRYGQHRQKESKMSSSSIPESCVTREDPSTKYELLNELGKHNL